MSFRPYLIMVILIICGKIGSSQITIDDQDMPIPNQIFNVVNATPSSTDPSLTGENYTWDFSDLVEIDNYLDTALAIDNTPDLFQLFFNNPFIYPGYVSDYGFTGQDLSLGALEASNVLNFYRTTATTYEATGFGTELNGSPIPVLYDPKDVVYEFPMNYSDSTYSFAHFEIQIPTIGYWEEDIERINEVDGWGMVTTPAGTFEALRVKTTLNLVDSIYIDFFMTGTTIVQPTRIEYKWIAKNFGVPVLTITDLGGLGFQASYLNEIVDDIQEIPQFDFTFYPNPVLDILYIENNKLEKYNLINTAGKTIKSGSMVNTLDLSDVPNGMYLLRLGEFKFQKVLKGNQ